MLHGDSVLKYRQFNLKNKWNALNKKDQKNSNSKRYSLFLSELKKGYVIKQASNKAWIVNILQKRNERNDSFFWNCLKWSDDSVPYQSQAH